MRAKLVVFPIRGRNWCFSRSIDHSLKKNSAASSSHSPSTFKELWKDVNVGDKPFNAKAELLADYCANKMNKAWIGLEKAPDGSIKKKIHGLGLWLLSRVKPSEIFLKSISKEVTSVEVIYPSSLNAQLVRRRLRHIAMSVQFNSVFKSSLSYELLSHLQGTIIHRKYLYATVSVIPLTSALTVLPLPNVPFFWVSFRAYSHWRALQGSEKLFQLASNGSKMFNTSTHKKETEHKDPTNETHNSSHEPHLKLRPSEELKDLVELEDGKDGLSQEAITKICKIYDLNTKDVLKYEKSTF
ncbi:hypothetical protein HN51_058497 [Arachis hypogaea]|uniref:Uncharacterized protein n=1 Tax=Arachis hypogaea TaxID=3818 RepID=A0A444X1G6_ARAHY|nr:uncharacterized protein DS421_20g689980 [Arachis hypogaea]RYQ83499.1 hypothetical protein Ahy_B10g102188 [Arachis hypogaea]